MLLQWVTAVVYFDVNSFNRTASSATN
jgi:hypothetical protein